VSSRATDSSAAGRLDLMLVPAAPAVEAVTSGFDATALARLLERLPIGIVSVGPALRIEYLNAAARRLLAAGEVGEFLPDPWPVFSLRKFAGRLFTDTPVPRRCVSSANGRVLELDGIPPGGSSANALLLMEDVTARDQRSRAEREFVANAAHELRTPIAAIGGAIEVLQDGARDDPAARDRFLGHIQREADRLGRLASSLLLLARIQAGDGVTALRLVDVKSLLEEVASELEPVDGVAVRVSCESGLSVLADRDLLRQALLNVATNAARHTSDGEIELACREARSVCELEVRDTGSGISPTAQGRVFDRFFRSHDAADGGFGLGLAIAREIVRALGGSIELESVPGSGTRVRMRLPAARVVRS